MSNEVRRFASGATRDGKDGKINPEGALSPLVLRRFAEYMLEKQKLPDGTLRGADNWQLGIPRQVYMESICRHWLELWTAFRLMKTDKLGAQFIPDALEDLLCALLFNVQGLLHEILLGRDVKEEPAKPLISEVQFPSQGQDNYPGRDKLDIHGGQVEGPTKVMQGLSGYIHETPTGPVVTGFSKLDYQQLQSERRFREPHPNLAEGLSEDRRQPPCRGCGEYLARSGSEYCSSCS